MERVYWRRRALQAESQKKSSDNQDQEHRHNQNQNIIQSLQSQNQILHQSLVFQSFLLTVLVQFISYLQSSYNGMSSSRAPSESKMSSFTREHTSAPSSSSTLIIYMPLPTPGSVEAPHFDDMNIMDFLKAWEMLCQNHDVAEQFIVQRLPLYCNDLIGEHIKALSEYEARA